jgi:hypothetical protein
LSVEEKPFKRITKRLLTANPLLNPRLQLPPTPPPEGAAADEAAVEEAEKRKTLDERQQFREEVLLDFAAFESSIIRIQLLLNSNEKERERYAAEKLRIQTTAQDVRQNTIELRSQLEAAQATLELRKSWDELSEKITNNRLLRPREDQRSNLEKLNAEIIELERESRDYAETWKERRQQFGRIIEEGMNLRRLIRDEKEEVERREGMEGREDGDDGEGGSTRGRISGVGTPRPETGGATPLHPGLDGGGDPGSLTVDGRLHPRGRSPLRARSPATVTEEVKADDMEDINMAEDGEISGDENGDLAEEDLAAEEREANSRGYGEDMATNERMDTS